MANFVLIGPGRSGSNMLRPALDQHSEIQCLDEIFLPKYFQETYIPQGKLTVGDILDGLALSPDKKLCGFTVLYNELFDSRNAAGLFDEFRQRRFSVIHVVRNNLM